MRPMLMYLKMLEDVQVPSPEPQAEADLEVRPVCRMDAVR
eukprot:SAG11_NODE_654_length_7909_cov_7.701280_7_plen_40_part_00